jgi:hypothetical protein
MKNYIKRIKNISESNKLFSLILFKSIGVIRIIINNVIKIKFLITKYRTKKKILKAIVIGPIHSKHLGNFLNTFVKYTNENHILQLILINSDPNALVKSINFKHIIIDKSIYSILGYKDNFKNWQKNIYLNALNLLQIHAQRYIENHIINFQPDILWIHDLQSAGYLTSSILESVHRNTINTKICASIWGNDLYHFHDDKIHNIKLRSILSKINFLHAESIRDEIIARELCFMGRMLPISSITLTDINVFKKIGHYVTKVKDIFVLLKGSYYLRSNLTYLYNQINSDYLFWVDKKIVIIGATEEEEFFFRKLKFKYQISIEMYESISHDLYLNFLHRSKYHLSCNLSDGIPNTSAESVYCNCIPIFTNHTGLNDLLSEHLKKFLIYELSKASYKNIFITLESMKDDHKKFLEELINIFERKVFNQEIYKEIFNTLEITNFK